MPPRKTRVRRTTRRKWIYPRRTEEMVRRQAREAASEAASEARFEHDLIAAYRGDTKPLREYLLSDDRLTPDHRAELAVLIYWRIQKKLRGKRGKSAPTFNLDYNLGREAERQIADYVQKLKKQKYGNRRLPRGGLGKFLDEVIEQLDSHGFFDDYRGTMSKERILADLKRGKRSPKL